MKLKSIITSISLLIAAYFANAQDFHLSQYESSPIYLNPALTGLKLDQGWDYRINAGYRDQWFNSTGTSFKTFSFGFDMPINEKFSLGQYIVNNSGSDGIYNALNVMFSGAYKIAHTTETNPHNLSVGLQAGFLQKSFNHGSFVYDSQYSVEDPDGFDTGIPSGESFVKESFFKLDANIGVYYQYAGVGKKFSPFIGYSISHFNQPGESFITEVNKTPMRINLNGGVRYLINDNFNVQPQFLYTTQAKTTDLNIGVLGFYRIPGSKIEPMIGVAYRNKDAMIINAGLKLNNCIIKMSYDFTTSYLKKYIDGRGGDGFEMSVVFMGKKAKRKVVSPSTPIQQESPLEEK